MCAAASASSKVTILKRPSEKLHLGSKLPLIGIHRIFMNGKTLAKAVDGCSKPGTKYFIQAGLLSQDEEWTQAADIGDWGLAMSEDQAFAYSIEGDEADARRMGLF